MAMHNFKKTFYILIAALAADVEATVAAVVAPFAGVVESVKYVPNAAIAGQAANNRKHELVNKGQAGAGATVVAELQYNAGVNAAAFDAKALTNSEVAGATDVAAGDVLAFVSSAPGTGLADPGGLLEVVIARSAE